MIRKQMAVGIFLFCMAMVCGCGQQEDAAHIDIIEALSNRADDDCMQTADGVKPIRFPEDAGPHENFRTEWWYYTGNLHTPQGRHFGYQLTFFRQAFSCEKIENGSKWRTRQLYFAHFAVTDTRGNRFFSDDRMNRKSIGIAGAEADPFRVWIDDWQVEAKGDSLQMNVKNRSVGLSLTLTALKPPVLQGDRGYSRKGPDRSNASFYYSLPRLATAGEVTVDGEPFSVTGHTWFDHEWSTSALDRHTAGWDWFSVHLDDGRDLMVCRIRNDKGQPNGYGFGSIIFPDGSYEILSENQFELEPLTYWTSDRTKRTYPSKWRISIPFLNLEFIVRPVMDNQEHAGDFVYWEGAARFEGRTVSGMGYVELTGY